MKPLVLALASCLAAQMQLPPGTSSAVPDTQQTAPASAQAQTLGQAEDAIAAGRFQDAVTLLLPLATATQSDARIFYDLGFAQDALGHDTEAALAYRAALERKPQDGTARVSLGLLLARSGDRAGGEQQLAQAVKGPALPPDVAARAYRALAQMHVESNASQANDELLAALKLSAETPQDAALAATIADAQHDDSAAEQAYRHAQQLAPTDAEVALGYARLLSRRHKYTEAEAVLQAARNAHKENRELLAEYASQELLLGHLQTARTLLEDLHTTYPKDAAVARLLASAYVASGEPALSNPLYSSLLAAYPNDSGLQVEWADALIRQKRSAEAEPVLQALIVKGNTPPELLPNALGMLAFAASSNHQPEVVLQALQKRETLMPATAPYTFLAATAHDTLRHTKQAVAQYQLFLQQAAGNFPDQEWQARQRLQLLERNR